MKISLEPIVWDNFDDVIELELEKSQEKNLPSNVYSIAESSLSPLFHPRAVCVDGKVVGFAMYQFGEIGDADEEECTIWRFMIDKRHQNGGIGKITMGILIDEIKAHNRCSLIDIYYSSDNIAAVKIYSSYGFEVVGSRDDGDLIAELKL